MKFLDPDMNLSGEDISAVARELGLSFPGPLESFFLENNGASPEPYVLRTETLHTVVSETLALVSNRGRATAVDSYRTLVLEKAIVAVTFFPFAVDAGGDYFFVDCDSPEAAVYFFRADHIHPATEAFEKVADSLTAFWEMLESEAD